MNLTPVSRLPRRIIFALFLMTLLLQSGASTANNPVQLQRAAEHLRANRNLEALQELKTLTPSGRTSLMAGEAALRLKRYDEAVSHLSDAERDYPLLADVALALKAEALFSLKRFPEAHLAAAAAARTTPLPSRSRRMEKLAADALFETGDPKAALPAYQQFLARYTLGADYLDALLKSALCLERLGVRSNAIAIYRSIWLQHPAATQAETAFSRLKALETEAASGATSFTLDEQLERGKLLLANNQPAAAAWAFSVLPRTDISEDLAARIDLLAGQAAIKQRHYSLAGPLLKRAAAAHNSAVRDEARLMLARLEERTGESDRALARFLVLASERGSLAGDALLGAAFVHKHAGRFAEAALLLERLTREFPASGQAALAGWELAWGRYLSGDLTNAETSFRILTKNPVYRERSLYWLARISQRQNRPQEAEQFYATLLKEYPFGFYAVWHRQQTGKPAQLEPVPADLPEPPLPPGSERAQALIELGILEEARIEIAALKNQLNQAQMPGLARIQQLAGDYHGSILTFHQNRPATWERSTLPFWRLGYPRHYAELISRYSATHKLSEALVLSLAKAESSFRADVKSHAGAIGLMQLMPATARMTAGYRDKKPYNPLWLTDPDYNVRLGTRHLRSLLDQYQQETVFALAAYNAGSGALSRWRKGFGHLEKDEFIENIPYQETRDYVKKIIASIGIYQALYKIQ